jgi:DNA-binding NtrC family response regulator
MFVWSYDAGSDSYSGIADSSYANLKLGAAAKHNHALKRYQAIATVALSLFELQRTKVEAARHLGVSVSTLNRALANYRIPNNPDPLLE